MVATILSIIPSFIVVEQQEPILSNCSTYSMYMILRTLQS